MLRLLSRIRYCMVVRQGKNEIDSQSICECTIDVTTELAK